jgi:hypothetical protein
MAAKINGTYFSGAQASLFIGDTWVDDVASISWNIQQNKQPIYGYGSQHWDFIAEGIVSVSGEFAINFREPNYLWMILERNKRFSLSPSELEKTRTEINNKDINTLDNTFQNDPRYNLDLFFAATPGSLDKVARDMTSKFTTSPVKKTTERTNHHSFNMTIGYGNLGPDTIGEKINSIQILGKSKVIQSDGRPVMEVYSFIARDIS